MAFRDDRDALLARNDALQRELDDAREALADKERELEAARNPPPEPEPPVSSPPQKRGTKAKRRRARGARRDAGPDSTNLLLRILSVFTRAWVIVVWGLPGLFLAAGLITAPGYRLHAGLALAALSGFAIAVDAYVRRCRSCRKLLAGKLLSIVSDNYGGHVRSWRCVFCGRSWKT